MTDKEFKSQYDLADLLFPERRPSTDFEVLDVPLEKRRLVTDSLDFTVSTIVDLMTATFLSRNFSAGMCGR